MGQAVSADLVFDPTPACATDHHFGSTNGQDLLLNRAMLSVFYAPYVGRFARDWHRLATTDHSQPWKSLYFLAKLAFF
jgi:hypothetical protein